MNPHRHIVPEDFFGAERADRLSANELARDIIEQGVRGERRHPGLDIVGVAGGDMVGNRLGQAVGDVGRHGDFLRAKMHRPRPFSCQFPSGDPFQSACAARWALSLRTSSVRDAR
jgi:hypothetical protein